MMANKDKFSLLNPDFSIQMWKSIEQKLGRQLTPEENEWYFYTSGMYKEWLGNSLKNWSVEETEWWIVNRKHPMFTAGPNRKPKPKGLVEKILSVLLGW